MLRRWLSSNVLSVAVTFLVTSQIAVLIILGAIRHFVDQTPPDGNGVAILGTVTQFDCWGTQELFVTWSIVGHGEYRLQAMAGESSPYSAVNRAVDVYLNDPTNPAFSYDPTIFPKATTGDSYVSQHSVSFDLVHRVMMGERYYAPFAQYKFTASAFVIDKATNRSIPITVFELNNPGQTDFNMTSTQVPARNNFTYNATGGPATVEVESCMMFGTITHSLCIGILFLLMMGFSWGLCIWAVQFTRSVLGGGQEVRDGAVFLPMTLMFSIPTIRSLYINSLPFGVFLDVIGIYPQMLALSFCAMIITRRILRKGRFNTTGDNQ